MLQTTLNVCTWIATVQPTLPSHLSATRCRRVSSTIDLVARPWPPWYTTVNISLPPHRCVHPSTTRHGHPCNSADRQGYSHAHRSRPWHTAHKTINQVGQAHRSSTQTTATTFEASTRHTSTQAALVNSRESNTIRPTATRHPGQVYWSFR